MFGKSSIILLLIAGLFVFGCAQPESAPEQPQPSETPPTTEQPTAEEPEQPEAPEEPEPTGDDTLDLTDLGYMELAALGVPIQCDVTITQMGEVMHMKMYMQGEDKVRSEYSSSDTQMYECPKMISIMAKDKVYLGCEGQQLMPDLDCDWLMFEGLETDGEAGDGGAAGGMTMSPSDFEGLPPTSFSCQPWIFDESKFSTPGKVCTMEDLMQGYQP